VIETAISNLLKADDSFRQLAGNRLFPVELPEQEALPAVTYQLISTTDLYAIDGAIDFTRVRLQFDVWANRYLEAKDLARALHSVLDSYSGDLSGVRVWGIQRVRCDDQFDSEARIRRVSVDYAIQFSQLQSNP
jgi:hypothetical protein